MRIENISFDFEEWNVNESQSIKSPKPKPKAMPSRAN